MQAIDTEEQDRADMQRLAAGHDGALNELMERHAGPVFQFLYRMLASEEEAHDLAQETFVRVYRHCQRFDRRAKFTTWLYTIAGNLARNEHRRRSRHPSVSLEAEDEQSGGRLEEALTSGGTGPREQAEANERQQAVRAAIGSLPQDLREAVVLCEWEDLSAAEAAEVLQTSRRAVESRVYRARKLLRQKLQRWL
jgi:RNA polymerase sigma-70 factor (ECF subfamily)